MEREGKVGDGRREGKERKEGMSDERERGREGGREGGREREREGGRREQ